VISRRACALYIGGATLAMPLVVKAQLAGKVPTVGVLRSGQFDRYFPEFLKKFGELGYEDGRNVRLVVRSAETKLARLPELAAELVQLKVEVIVSVDTPPTRAAIAATKEIPIVMSVGDAIAIGFVSNLSPAGRKCHRGHGPTERNSR
jgi:putative ABC transport system substrate-binding protein